MTTFPTLTMTTLPTMDSTTDTLTAPLAAGPAARLLDSPPRSLKTYDEIRDIIVNRLGIKDQESYRAWCELFHDSVAPRIPTQDDIDLLSPDAVDNRDFWRVARDLFSTDPVANCRYGQPLSIDQANRNNMHLYNLSGFTGLAQHCKDIWFPQHLIKGLISTLEIGPGYGAFRDYLYGLGCFAWHGADVFPLIDGVDQSEATGLLSPLTKSRQYSLAVSCNVFQHLSVKQRRAHYADVFQCLHPQCLFQFNLTVDTYPDDANHRDANGRVWLRHYGQFTEIQKVETVVADVQAAGFQLLARNISYVTSMTTLTFAKPAAKPTT